MKTKEYEITKKVKRLKYLSSMLKKYSHKWNGGECSHRIRSWVYEYNEIKEENKEAFNIYCEIFNYDKTHDAFDCMA